MLSPRSVDEARALDAVTEAELHALARLETPFQAWDRSGDRVVEVRAWDQHPRGSRPITTVHGLSGHALVCETEGAMPWRVRVHFCKARKCGVKWDNRKEPFLFHGVFLQKLFDDEGNDAGAASVVDAPSLASSASGARRPAAGQWSPGRASLQLEALACQVAG